MGLVEPGDRLSEHKLRSLPGSSTKNEGKGKNVGFFLLKCKVVIGESWAPLDPLYLMVSCILRDTSWDCRQLC